MSNLVDKVYIGLDNAPPAFDIRGRLLGPNGTNLEYIRSETGVVAVLKGDKFEPLHLALHHTRTEALTAAKSLALNLIETIRAELAQWSAAQAGGPPPSLSVPPPALATCATTAPVTSVTTVSLSGPSALSSTAQSVLSPMVSVAPSSAPLMAMRPPAVLQFLPQQQYVLNQENGQLIPIVQPGMPMSNPNFTTLPIAQPLNTLQQPFGTQIVDLSSGQPVNVTQFRFSGVPTSLSMILPNNLTLPQSSTAPSSDITTVSSATLTPVVCAAPSMNCSQKIVYSSDKTLDKSDTKFQNAETVQWTVPGSQTMLIPYPHLQELTNHTGLPNLQPQQFVHITPAGSVSQTSFPLTASQLQHLQATTVMQLNQKPSVSSASLINIISSGQASTPIHSSSTTSKSSTLQTIQDRGQKRLSDGTPSQLQLRPIAPAGSHVSQEKGSLREGRLTGVWSAGAARDSTTNLGSSSMTVKMNPTHGTIIVSSGQQTSVTGTPGTDNSGMYIRQIDRNTGQFQTNKDGQKLDQSKLQNTTQNVHMITVPQGMTVLQNPLNLSQMQTVLGQPNSQVYMIPTNQPNLIQAGGLPPGLIGSQVLQPGQNVTMMPQNQLGLPNNVQYSTMPLMPMGMMPNAQFTPGTLNLNNVALANQQMSSQNLVPNVIPIVAGNTGALSNPSGASAQTASGTQINPMLPQSNYIPPTTQYTSLPPQYVIHPNASQVSMQPTNTQYTLPVNSPNQTTSTNPQTNTPETDVQLTTLNPPNIQNIGTYLNNTSQQSSYTPNAQNNQNFPSNESTSSQNQTSSFTPATQLNPPALNQVNYPASTQNSTYSTANQTGNFTQSNTLQNAQQPHFSPSNTSSPPGQYPSNSSANQNGQFASNQSASAQNYQNAAYAANQYQYNNRPWFRPRFGSPQNSPYNPGTGPPPNGPSMQLPPPSATYNYWQDN